MKPAFVVAAAIAISSGLADANELRADEKTDSSSKSKKTFAVPIDKPQVKHFLGVYKPGDKIPLRLSLLNSTQDGALIKSASVSCACVEVSPGRSRVEPSKQSFLSAAINAGSRLGHHSQTITINGVFEDGKSWSTTVLLEYDVFKDFAVFLNTHRWVIDTSRPETFSLRGTLRAYHGFDLRKIAVDVAGLSAKVHRSRPHRTNNGYVSQEVTLTVKEPSEVKTVSVVTLTCVNKTNSDRSVERIFVVPRSDITISPARPRFSSGKLMILVRFASPPAESLRFSIEQNGDVHYADSVRKLSGLLYRVEFLSDERFDAVIDIPTKLRVRIGKDSFSLPLSDSDQPREAG